MGDFLAGEDFVLPFTILGRRILLLSDVLHSPIRQERRTEWSPVGFQVFSSGRPSNFVRQQLTIMRSLTGSSSIFEAMKRIVGAIICWSGS